MRKPFWRRRREAQAQRRAAAVPDVVRHKGDAEQQMRFFDQLGPTARRAIATSRFDDDAIARWREGFVAECRDPELAERVRRADDRHSGSFGPAFPRGI